MGTQPPVESRGEDGALCVIDLIFGGRIAIHAIPGDTKLRRVVVLAGHA
jgi:hypothetical protein